MKKVFAFLLIFLVAGVFNITNFNLNTSVEVNASDYCYKESVSSTCLNEHDYEISYLWNEDYSSCTASAVCSVCGDKIVENAVISTNDDKIFATFTNQLFEIQIYQILGKTDGLNADEKINFKVKTKIVPTAIISTACIISMSGIAITLIVLKRKKN